MLSMAPPRLLGKPRVLLLDEPLEGLAPVICDETNGAAGRASRPANEVTIVLVEQQIEPARWISPSPRDGHGTWPPELVRCAGRADRGTGPLVDRLVGVGIH